MEKVLEKINLIQQEVGKISKNAENPFHNSTYANLTNIQDSLQAFLEANKLMVYHTIVDKKVVTTVYDIESKESLSSSIDMTQTDAQKKGSEITYFRRYNLVCIFDLNVADDDGNEGGNATPSKPQKSNNVKVDNWLTDKNFLAMKGKPKAKISEYIAYYDCKTKQSDGLVYGMKKAYKMDLLNLLQ